MEPIKKSFAECSQKQCVSDGKSCSEKIQITLISEEEREIYKVPTYGYILP